jgi:hypothetical protein
VLAFAFFAGPSLAKTGTIALVQGQVTDASSAPLPGASVVVEDGSHNLIARTTSDSSGNFSFTNVTDGGTGRVRVIAWYASGGQAYNATKLNPAWYPANQSVINISPSDTHIATPAGNATQTGPGASLPFTALGQVTDERGNGVANATVTLYDGIYQVIGTTTTDQGGNFGFTNVVANSPGCKLKVNYTAADGKRYESSLNNMLWYPTDTGIVKFSPQETQLAGYPELADTGYVWGTITDAAGTPLSGTVYLANGTVNLSIQTYASADAPGFISEVSAGNYTAYSEHVDANGTLKSKPVSIEVQPALKYLDTNALTFVVEQAAPAGSATPTTVPSASQPAPFVSPALLVVAMIAAVFAAGAAEALKRRK